MINMGKQLTEGDVRKIQEELHRRTCELRPQLLDAVKEAKAFGDLSENFEYYAAKREKNRNESRIRYLERMLATSEILEDDTESDEVGVENTVELYMEHKQVTKFYRIVTTVRANSLKNRISIESPVARAIIGHKVGERVYVKVNDTYGYYVQIRSIDPSTDGDDDEINSY